MKHKQLYTEIFTPDSTFNGKRISKLTFAEKMQLVRERSRSFENGNTRVIIRGFNDTPLNRMISAMRQLFCLRTSI